MEHLISKLETARTDYLRAKYNYDSKNSEYLQLKKKWFSELQRGGILPTISEQEKVKTRIGYYSAKGQFISAEQNLLHAGIQLIISEIGAPNKLSESLNLADVRAEDGSWRYPNTRGKVLEVCMKWPVENTRDGKEVTPDDKIIVSLRTMVLPQ